MRTAAVRAVALAGALALAGCAPAAPAVVRPASPPAGASGTPTPAAGPTPADLATLRERAGIPDCPVPTGPPPAPVADGLPDVALACLGSDRTLNLASLRGTPMVVNLWAQWCPPCRAEAPHLREFAAQAGDRVLMLGIDYGDPQPDWAIEFAALAGWTWPHVVDPERRTAPGLRLQGIPLTLLVDADGRIVHRFNGAFSSSAELRALVEEHLGVTT